jgi:hypothetical protein
MMMDPEDDSIVRAYRVVFNSPDGRIVLQHLAEFCRAAESCFHADPRLHAMLEGRREVFLRIHHFAKLSDDEVVQMVAGRRLRLSRTLFGESDE